MRRDVDGGGTGAPSDRHDISLPPSRLFGRGGSSPRMPRRRSPRTSLFARLVLNGFNPPRRPIVQTILGLAALGLLALPIAATIGAEHVRADFHAASACPTPGVVPAGCRGVVTTGVTGTRTDRDGKGHRSGFDLYLAGPVPAEGWIHFNGTDDGFESSAVNASFVTAQVFDGAVVALTAQGATKHTSKWPDSVVWTDVALTGLCGLAAIIMLRSAGRALWWRSLGGRRRGPALMAMRVIDIVVLAIALASTFVLDVTSGVGIAMIVAAQAVLLAAWVIPPIWARRCSFPQVGSAGYRIRPGT